MDSEFFNPAAFQPKRLIPRIDPGTWQRHSFMNDFSEWYMRRGAIVHDSFLRPMYQDELIDFYPLEFATPGDPRYMRGHRRDAGEILSMLYSEYDVVLGYERRLDSGHTDIRSVVQSAGQVHPCIHRSRTRIQRSSLSGMSQLSFPASNELAPWADKHFLFLRILKQPVILPLEKVTPDRMGQYEEFPFSGPYMLTGHHSNGLLNLSVLGGFDQAGEGGDLVGHIFLWLTIWPGKTDFSTQSFRVLSTVLGQSGHERKKGKYPRK